ELSVWEITYPAGTIAQLGGNTLVAGAVTDVAIATLDSTHVATASIVGGILNVSVFEVLSSGAMLPLSTATAGAVNEDSITEISSMWLATEARNGSNKLQVTAWEVSPGYALTKKSSHTNGDISGKPAAAPFQCLYCTGSAVNNNLLTGVINSSS